MGGISAPVHAAGVAGAMRVSRMWMSGSSSAAVDDIVQEVFMKLCEQEQDLKDFEPRGEDSFLACCAWCRLVANDYFRRIYSEKRVAK